jgi:multidrug efflux pump subunit AcrA (membrane-fusion protein)
MTAAALHLTDSWRWPAFAGWLIIALFFGGLGSWAALAPLNGAVVANGIVKVQGNRKSVQHLDGGIVKELHVKEGDHVEAGDLLIMLDDAQAKAEFEVLSQQLIVLRATEARLRASLPPGHRRAGAADRPARQQAHRGAGRAGAHGDPFALCRPGRRAHCLLDRRRNAARREDPRHRAR